MERKRIVVTDLTRMRDFDVCLAGIELDPFGQCVRPLLANRPGQPTLHPDEHWLLHAISQPIRPFAIIGFDAIAHRPAPPHTEDWAISGRAPTVERVLGMSEQQALLVRMQQPDIDDLFGETVHWNERENGLRSGGWVQPGKGTASLGTIAVKTARFRVFRDVTSGATKYSVTFRDAEDKVSRLSITDLAFRGWADSSRRSIGGSFEELDGLMRATFQPPRELWLRIGLARAWALDLQSEAVCYLQVTGVHTIPDYLEGAAWYDFRQKIA